MFLGIVQAGLNAILLLLSFATPGHFPIPLLILLVAALVQAGSAYQLSKERASALAPFAISSVLTVLVYLTIRVDSIFFSFVNLVPVALLYSTTRKEPSPSSIPPAPTTPEQAPKSKDEDLY